MPQVLVLRSIKIPIVSLFHFFKLHISHSLCSILLPHLPIQRVEFWFVFEQSFSSCSDDGCVVRFQNSSVSFGLTFANAQVCSVQVSVRVILSFSSREGWTTVAGTSWVQVGINLVRVLSVFTL